MKPFARIAAVLFAAAAVLISTPGCERQRAETAKKFVDEGLSKTTEYQKAHGKAKGDGHADKAKKDAAPAAAGPTPQKFIPENK